jgi:hypothetical protein
LVVLEGPCVIAGSRNNMLDVDLNFINNIFCFEIKSDTMNVEQFFDFLTYQSLQF